MRKRKIQVKKFNSFKEQEEADLKYWKRIDKGKRVEVLEIMRLNYLKMVYGRVPRLRRVYKVIERT